MQLNPQRIRQYLKSFDFEPLFINELGWDIYRPPLKVTADQHDYTLRAVAEKRGFVAYICPPGPDGLPPDHNLRSKIEHQVTRSVREHLIIFVDEAQTTQIWQWVRREPGKLLARREHHYHINQSGEALIQKLQAITFSLEEEEGLTLVDVIGGARAAFDVEKVTKRFYDLFKKERDAFHKFLSGIPETEWQRWYVSVMLNRLMFIYFFQRKGFLSGNENYLRDKLAESQNQGQDRFYREFLCPLFFAGFAQKEAARPAKLKKLLGTVPYLNGSLFVPHEIEDRYGPKIQIEDAAFERLFNFFDEWRWHLDERPLRNDREINPDVLGYIFEKYINQKQMGAYYTKEDITEYIAKNTVIPFLFDEARKQCKIAFEGPQSIWNLLPADPDRYIYDPIKKGVEYPLPAEIEVGLTDIAQRALWNTPAPEEFTLPTEIWREVIQRRQRYQEVKARLAGGEIRSINDFITYNLNLRQFAQDVIESCEGPELLRAFYKAIENVTILDPTVGSGAFLFAALNILEPLYEACIERMASFVADYELTVDKPNPARFKDFRETLGRIEQHPNRRYFILKSIIVNNLFGVDIMAEAVEICKLRLFLKLVAQVERTEQIEPLPDIDFNIRAGNTLVGYATYEEVKRALTEANMGQGTVSSLASGESVGRVQQNKLLFTEDLAVVQRFEQKVADVDRLFQHFRQQQTELGGQVTPADKQELRRRLKDLEDELNQHLTREYGVDTKKAKAYQQWLESHQPFHWFIEFYGILKQDRFDVIIGNPPYVVYNKRQSPYAIQNYKSEECRNLYAFTFERSLNLLRGKGRLGLIIPVSFASAEAFNTLRDVIWELKPTMWLSHFANRPGQLFIGAQNRLTIALLTSESVKRNVLSTRYYRWDAKRGEREHLFSEIEYVSLDGSARKFHGLFPKVGDVESLNILRKIENSYTIEGHLVKTGNYQVHWVRVPGYFCQFLLEAPKARPEGGGPERIRGEVNSISIRDEVAQRAIHSILNSSTYNLFFCAYTDGRHINPSDVRGFPLDLKSFDSATLKLLAKFSSDLEKCFEVNTSQWRKSGLLIDSIDSKPCKHIIDKIDQVLAQHYGFTGKELDLIINYDIKYRMGLSGRGGEDENDETEEEE